MNRLNEKQMITTSYENKIASRVFIPEEIDHSSSSIFSVKTTYLFGTFSVLKFPPKRNEPFSTIVSLNDDQIMPEAKQIYEFEMEDFTDDYDRIIEPEKLKTFHVKLKITSITQFEPEIFLEDLD